MMDSQYVLRTRRGNRRCVHYDRDCLILAECCSKLFPCRHCHDASENHEINRFEVKQVLCLECGLLQNINRVCARCRAILASYFCASCKFLVTTDKEIFHCSQCGICRVGNQSGYFHCQKCDACMEYGLKENHRHIENSLKTNCPICAEYLFESLFEVLILKCGHAIHKECYNYYLESSFQCPICLHSIGDLTRYNQAIDKLVKQTNTILDKNGGLYFCDIKCYDCKNESQIHQSNIFHKCKFCGSYNTKIKKIHTEDK
ncbi:RING finger and CHY zinc finger domain-containing protein 1 [Astathelohania contejeani]|uniref:RING finger and CHY zinc finger domain-containing protein 1 n=1 Tax=Astathelohania contejeani TaxID=164912 RepID=A0ABQ7HX60_9MICR|nr:RING finger and CHY zinc finger domain-containing protein 1 [Thelohania contejeani]